MTDTEETDVYAFVCSIRHRHGDPALTMFANEAEAITFASEKLQAEMDKHNRGQFPRERTSNGVWYATTYENGPTATVELLRRSKHHSRPVPDPSLVSLFEAALDNIGLGAQVLMNLGAPPDKVLDEAQRLVPSGDMDMAQRAARERIALRGI